MMNISKFCGEILRASPMLLMQRKTKRASFSIEYRRSTIIRRCYLSNKSSAD